MGSYKYSNLNFAGHRSINRPDGSTQDSWHTYTCGHCNSVVSGAVVASFDKPDGPIKWLLCTSCSDGSVLTQSKLVYPIPVQAPSLQGLPPETASAFVEAHKCFSIQAFTSCELISRKILMHVAVDKGAKIGDRFENYIDYLENQGYVTPPMRPWVQLIRKHGNESTHELASPDEKRAKSTLTFTSELLRLIYDMEYLSKQSIPP